MDDDKIILNQLSNLASWDARSHYENTPMHYTKIFKAAKLERKKKSLHFLDIFLFLLKT